jgi:hypothetical protein
VTELLKSVLGGQTRTLLAAVGGYFVLKGWLSPEQSASIESDALAVIAKYAALVGPSLWSMYAKYRASLLTLAASQLPADASEGDIRARAVLLGFSDLVKAPTKDLRNRMAMLEARVHDLEAKS